MSAIFGVVGAASPSELDEMGRRLAHRGGHSRWSEIHPGIYFGLVGPEDSTPASSHGMTSIVDASFEEHRSRVRVALRASDPTVTLQAEPNMPFACAAYAHDTQTVLLARDYFGLKPLHFCRLASGGFAFATEYKALLAINEVEAVPDIEALEHLQIYKAVPAGRTLLKGVFPVPPGSVLYLDAQGEMRRAQRMREIDLQVHPMSEQMACKRLREKLLEATSRLVGNRSRIAIALSGGIDSLSVAAMARHVAPEAELIGITAGECPEDPEVHRAAHAMSHLKGQHETVFVSNEELIAKLPLAVWHLENPIGRSETFQYFAIAKRARELGVDSLLTGMGADLLFGGMPRHKVLWMAEAFPQLSTSLLAFFMSTQTGQKPSSWLARGFMKLYYRGDLMAPPHVLNAPTCEVPELVAAPGPEFLNRCLMLDGQEPTSRTLARIERPLQAFSIDYTSPYLDTSIVDFAFTIPGGLKIKNGTQKYILRKAMQPLVGPQLYKAPKELMRMKQNLDFAQALDSLASRYLSSERIRRRGFFDEAQVKQIRTEALRVTHPENVMRLWTLLVTEIWAEIYIDGRGRHPTLASASVAQQASWAEMPAPALP
jgi:asparagine synthase (glutamine-hydrolysing)